MSVIRCLQNLTRHDDPASELWIIDGQFAAPPADAAGAEIIDTDGGWWLPLAVDLCARVREPGATHKATLSSETAAAVRAGVGSLCVDDPQFRGRVIVARQVLQAADNAHDWWAPMIMAMTAIRMATP